MKKEKGNGKKTINALTLAQKIQLIDFLRTHHKGAPHAWLARKATALIGVSITADSVGYYLEAINPKPTTPAPAPVVAAPAKEVQPELQYKTEFVTAERFANFKATIWGMNLNERLINVEKAIARITRAAAAFKE